MAVLDQNGNQIPVGKAGSGFKVRQLAEAKKLFDSGPFAVEVELNGISREAKIRFPVFKCFRPDLSVVSFEDVGIHQFITIPVTT